MIRIKCHYELKADYYTVISPFIGSFEKFLNKHKVLGEATRNSHRNFLTIFRMLTRPKNKIKPDVVLEKMSQMEQLINRSWLEEKVAELT